MAFHVACPFSCKPICYCVHGPGGRATPEEREAAVERAKLLAKLLENPQQLWTSDGDVAIPVPGIDRKALAEQAQLAGEAVADTAELEARERELRERLAGAVRAEKRARALGRAELEGDGLSADSGDDDSAQTQPGVAGPVGRPKKNMKTGASNRGADLPGLDGLVGTFVQVYWDLDGGDWYLAEVRKAPRGGGATLWYPKTEEEEVLDGSELWALIREGKILRENGQAVHPPQQLQQHQSGVAAGGGGGGGLLQGIRLGGLSSAGGFVG